MRPMLDMDTIQIVPTNRCVLRCGNCTHLSNSAPNYDMTLEQYQAAVDSLADWPRYHNEDLRQTRIVGMIGGEPLLHKDFPAMCEYARAKIGKQNLGLWTTFPQQFAHYREIIVETFDFLFVNDHSRPDIMHGPILVAADDVFPRPEDKAMMWHLIHHCWLQNSWSAAITPKGAFFCEVAAELSWMFGGKDGWPVEPGWWKRMPWEFRDQIEDNCHRCGAAMPLPMRSSQDIRDDISPSNLQTLQLLGTDRKVKQGHIVESDCKLLSAEECRMNEMGGGARYKDTDWRQGVAGKYGIFLEVTERGFWRPHLKTNWQKRGPSLFEQMQASQQGPYTEGR